MAEKIVLDAMRAAFTGFGANNRGPLRALLANDVVFEFPETVPYGGHYVGLSAYEALWVHLYETYYQSFDYDLVALIDGGDHVVVQATARAVALGGEVLHYDQCLVFRVDGSRVVHGRVYADTARLRGFLTTCGLLCEQAIPSVTH